MVRLKGNLSKRTLDSLKRQGVKVKLVTSSSEASTSLKERSKKSRGETSGTVKVISFDRIVLSKKWTGKLDLKQGDSVKIRLEDKSLILTK